MSRILIVDDSPIMRKNLRSILTQAGHIIVAEASNGTQAYIEYCKHIPDLVTMDITMPYMNGLDTFKKIIKAFPSAKIIIISSSNDNMIILDAIQNGAKNYIIKPFVVDKVLDVINQVLKVSKKLSNETIDNIYNSIQSAENSFNDMNHNLDINECEVLDIVKVNTESDQHFSIMLKNNAFIVYIDRDIVYSSMLALLDIMNSFLFVKPLKIVLELSNMRLNDYDIVSVLTDYIRKVQQAHGKTIIITRNNDLFNLFRSQNITTYTDFYSDLSEFEY
jgi:two-component system chemotaxis response regulator CheY